MPYLSTEKTKQIRKTLKSAFPKFRFSVRNRNHTGIAVTILSGPIELRNNPENHYESVNEFYIDKHYDGQAREFLSGVLSIVDKDNGVQSTDVDYGNIPKYYVRISIGDYRRAYQVTS